MLTRKYPAIEKPAAPQNAALSLALAVSRPVPRPPMPISKPPVFPSNKVGPQHNDVARATIMARVNAPVMGFARAPRVIHRPEIVVTDLVPAVAPVVVAVAAPVVPDVVEAPPVKTSRKRAPKAGQE